MRSLRQPVVIPVHSRSFAAVLLSLALLLSACSSDQHPPSAAKDSKPAAIVPRPADESRHLPKANLVDSQVVDQHLLGKSFMPGGTLGHYKKGATKYDMFIARLPSITDAAITLPDWNKALAGAKLVPSFGGYFGDDAGRPVFVFSKGAWIAGVAGLPQKEADAAARLLAAQLN